MKHFETIIFDENETTCNYDLLALNVAIANNNAMASFIDKVFLGLLMNITTRILAMLHAFVKKVCPAVCFHQKVYVFLYMHFLVTKPTCIM